MSNPLDTCLCGHWRCNHLNPWRGHDENFSQPSKCCAPVALGDTCDCVKFEFDIRAEQPRPVERTDTVPELCTCGHEALVHRQKSSGKWCDGGGADESWCMCQGFDPAPEGAQSEVIFMDDVDPLSTCLNCGHTAVFHDDDDAVCNFFVGPGEVCDCCCYEPDLSTPTGAIPVMQNVLAQVCRDAAEGRGQQPEFVTLDEAMDEPSINDSAAEYDKQNTRRYQDGPCANCQHSNSDHGGHGVKDSDCLVIEADGEWCPCGKYVPEQDKEHLSVLKEIGDFPPGTVITIIEIPPIADYSPHRPEVY